MHSWFKNLFARTSPKKSNHDSQAATGRQLTCKEVVELVSDYLEGTLLPEQQKLIEEHLAACDGCTNYVEQLRMTIGMLRSLAREPDFPDTKEELLEVFREWKKG